MPGIFSSYVPPGVFTRTLFEPAVNTLIDSIRLPVFVGIGQETLTREDYELLRGSSAIADTLITKEDVDLRWVLDESNPANVTLGATDGTKRKFKVSKYPITTGNGSGTTTTKVSDVIVYVNSEKVIVSSIDGANGYITLQSAPATSALTRVTYYYKRTDTKITDDVSKQADGANKVFKVFNVPIVDGTNGGITSTTTTDVVVKVDGVAVTVSAISGAKGEVTLATAPAANSTVQATYYFNAWQNTFDYLPDRGITTVVRVGRTPGDASYINETDFIVKDDLIYWGASYQIRPVIHTSGAEYFDDTQVSATLVDNKVYLEEATAYVDPTTSVTSKTIFKLAMTPTLGNGRDTTLGASLYNSIANGRIDVVSDRPDLVTAYVGVDVVDAMSRPAVTVTKVDGTNRLITLTTAISPNEKVFATYYQNWLADDTYTLTCKTAGASGVGTYEVKSTLRDANIHYIPFISKAGISQTLNWDTGNESLVGAYHTGAGKPVDEYVRLTIANQAARGATLKTSLAGPWLVTATTDKVKINGTTVTLTKSTGATLTGTSNTANATRAVVTSTAPDATYTITGLTLIVTIDGGAPQTITFSANYTAASQVVTAINAAAVGYTASNTGNNIVLTSNTYGVNSIVLLGNGTANAELGFTNGQTATGTEDYDVAALTLLVTVDGIAYTVAFASQNQTIAQLKTTIEAAVTTLTVSNVNGAVKLTATSVGTTSTIKIGNGSANAELGFTADQTATGANTPVATIATDLDTGLNATAIGAVVSGSHVVLTTDATGTATSIAIETVTNNAYTALGFEVGQTDVGEDAHQNYTVASFKDAAYTLAETAGSGTGATTTGIVGQTYVDAKTGLRFVLLAPVGASTYDDAGVIKFQVTKTFTTHSANPIYAILGLEVKVANTTSVGVGDTAEVESYDRAGNEPSTGDTYYATYKYAKTNYDAKVFSNFKDIEREYGKLAIENKLTLAMYLAILNGALLVAGKQVKSEAGNGVSATSTDMINAIDSLRKPIERRFKPAVIVPVTTDQQVLNFTKTHCLVQSSIKYRQERLCIYGYGAGTTPTAAQTYAKALASTRMVGVYPETAVVTLTDEFGVEVEHIVDGAYLAAAVAGSNVSPAYDVASPMTFRQIVGFKRLVREMDEVEKNQTAVAGLTVLEDLDPTIRVRQALTTDMSSSLTRELTITTTADHVQQVIRSALSQFIGVKFLGGVMGDIERVIKSALRSLIQGQIITKYASVKATPDLTDPTTILVEVVYVPVFPLNYIVCVMSIRSR